MMLSKPMAEACEANKTFLMSVIVQKEYSWTLLVGSAEGAESADAFRSTPCPERRGGRSPQRN